LPSRSSRALEQNAHIYENLGGWAYLHWMFEVLQKKLGCMMPMITMACMNVHGKWMQMVRSLMHVEFGECISIQCSNQHWRSGNARIHWISLHYKYAQMLLMVGWFSCIFSESTQRVTHTIPGTLHSWIHAQHNTTHLPVASRVDCCLFAVTCRASSTSATHVGIDSIDVLVSVHWLRFPIQFHRINPPRLRGEARAMTAMMSAMCRLTRSNP
jgi:hypothetical protein